MDIANDPWTNHTPNEQDLQVDDSTQSESIQSPPRASGLTDKHTRYQRYCHIVHNPTEAQRLRRRSMVHAFSARLGTG
jgi:hypothetical protein